jgi:TRAP-type C4-dicarboxylate transport system permease small subunit
MTGFKKITGILVKAEDVLLMTCLGTVFFALLLQVVSRYIFDRSLTWTEEFSRYIYVWITYFGVGFGIRCDAHIKITALIKFLPDKIQQLLQIFINCVILYCIYVYLPNAVIYYQIQAAKRSSALKLPMNWVTFPLIAGFIIAALYIISQVFRDVYKLLSKRGVP